MAFPGIGRKHGIMIDGAAKIVASGNIVERRGADEALLIFEGRVENPDSAGLAVGSVNVDRSPHVRRVGEALTGRLEWLLPDGMPIAWRSVDCSLPDGGGERPAQNYRPGALAERTGRRVGFLGSSNTMHERLAEQLTMRYPTLGVSGMWGPDPSDIRTRSAQLLLMPLASTGPEVGPDSRLLCEDGSPVPGLFGVGMESGGVPCGDLAGEASFAGQQNSRRLNQHGLGEMIYHGTRQRAARQNATKRGCNALPTV